MEEANGHINGEEDSETDEDVDLQDNYTDEEEVENVEDIPIDGADNLRKRAIARFILQLRACSNITQPSIDNVLSTLRDVVSVYVRDFFDRIEGILEQHEIELGEFVNIEEELQSIDCIQGLHTKYWQDKYFQEAFSVVQPQRYELGRGFVKHGSGVCGSDRPTKLKPNEMMFISICDVLKQWLQHRDFQDILEQHEPQDNVLSSYEDGLHFLNHPYFLQFPNGFRIVLSFDEAQMCNAVGPKATPENNLGMIYWSVGNMKSMYRTNLKFINLGGIVRSADITKFGMNEILKPFVEDLQRLQNGIEGPNGEIVYGALFAFSADNLGRHKVAGFKEGFSAAHPCLSCLANLKEVRTWTREDLTLVRTEEVYMQQVREVEQAVGDEKKNLSKRYGINRDTVLNQLIGFSAVTGIPPDVMHDLLEGVMPRTMQCYLRKVCLEQNKISLEELNARIQDFDYGYSELRSKPSVIKRQHITGKIHQTSSQTWLLAVILPIILRNFLDEDCEYSCNYTKMLQISSIALGHSVSIGMLDYFNRCVSEYLSDFQRLYADSVDEEDADAIDDGNLENGMEIVAFENGVAEDDVVRHNVDGMEAIQGKNLTQKQHYITHYARQFLIFGSLVQFWCMRTESKHSVFKNRSQSLNNSKNLALSLSNWHQLNQTWQMMFPLIKQTTNGPRKSVLTETLPFRNLFPRHPMLNKVSWLQYNGTKYIARKCYIPVGYEPDLCLPLFAELHTIIYMDDSPIFVCQAVRTIEHNVRLMAYKIITDSTNFITYRCTDLVSPNVYHSHVSEGETYVIVKQCFGDLH